jgi:hypothetical protein
MIPTDLNDLLIQAQEAFMVDENNEESGFKVVDRRSFNSEGSRRDDEAPEPRRVEPPVSTERARSKLIQTPTIESPESELAGEPSGFETLVTYLSTTTMFQLGLLAGPGGERIPPDMPNAQRTIELLEVVQEKTQGNLTPDESRLLDDVLYELRMTFVELQKRQARKG